MAARLVSAEYFSNWRDRTARKYPRRMRRIRASNYALREGSDLAGAEKCQRSETIGWRVSTTDCGTSQLRSHGYDRGSIQTPDTIELLHGMRLIDRSIWNGRSL